MDTMEERQNPADEEMREDSKANGDESDLDPENESEEEWVIKEETEEWKGPERFIYAFV